MNKAIRMNRRSGTRAVLFSVVILLCGLTVGCSGGAGVKKMSNIENREHASSSEYHIGPGDTLQIFVWRNPELSLTVPVRPEGKISTPLVEDMIAAGKTPTKLARDMEVVLSKYIKSPVVTVIVSNFVGTFDKQIRVVGQAANPQALSYRSNMTLLDVMIEVGGLTEFAAGNKAKIIRRVGGKQIQINAKLDNLLQKGDMRANISMQPGDILVVPESWF